MATILRAALTATLALAAAALAPTASGGARADDGGTPRVAVLYFDNNTGDRALDVLQKGFADMLVTDLSQAPKLTVVERDKLEAVLTELSLQRTSYFDPKTAVAIGRGLGATHAVTGAFAAFSPQMRIDIRLIDLKTGVVVLADKVVGDQSDVFELEQELVQRFLSGLSRAAPSSAMPQTRVKDVSALLEYARGLDLADRGDYQGAADRMGQAARRSPLFALARLRREDFLARLEQARARRTSALDTGTSELFAEAEAAVGAGGVGEAATAAEAQALIAWRVVVVAARLRALRATLAPARRATVAVVPRGGEAAVKGALAAYVDALEAVASDLRLHARRFTDARGDLPRDYRLPDAAQAKAREVGLSLTPPRDAEAVDLARLRFLALGRADDPAGSEGFTLAPTPADLDARYAREAKALAKTLGDAARARAAATPSGTGDVETILEIVAGAAVLHGQVEDAVVAWQSFLDAYPTAREFARVDKRIQVLLGVAHDHETSSIARYHRGIARCDDDMDFRVGVDEVIDRRLRTMGLAAIPATVEEVLSACRGKLARATFWPYLYMVGALAAGRLDDCAQFWVYVDRYLAENGSKTDLRGYLDNHVPQCKASQPGEGE